MRELHFHQHLARARRDGDLASMHGLSLQVATLNREHLTTTGLDPSGPVWWPHAINPDPELEPDAGHGAPDADPYAYRDGGTYGLRLTLTALRPAPTPPPEPVPTDTPVHDDDRTNADDVADDADGDEADD